MNRKVFAILLLTLLFAPKTPSYALFGQKAARAEAERQAKQAEENAALWRHIAGLTAVAGVIVVVIVAVARYNEQPSTSPDTRQDSPPLPPSGRVIDIEATVSQDAVPHHNGLMARQITYPAADKSNSQAAGPEISPQSPSLSGVYVVDGLNVCRSFSPQEKPSLAILLTLLTEIRRRGAEFICVFDATAPHVLRENSGAFYESVYRQLLRDNPAIFVQVPAGTSADDFILDHAAAEKLAVISNDRFKDHAVEHPWVSEAGRRIPGIVIGTLLKVRPLGISVPIDPNVQGMATGLRPTAEA